MAYFVYELTFPSGKKYVGRTSLYDKRMAFHRTMSRASGGHLLRKELKKSSGNFEDSIIAKCEYKEDANFIEDKKIEEYSKKGISLNVIRGYSDPAPKEETKTVREFLNDSAFVKAEFSRRIDWSRSQLNQWLKGKGNIPKKKFEALEKELMKYGYE